MMQVNQTAAKPWVLALTSVASFMMALDALVVTTALSTIRVDLSASIEALEWVVNAYNLSFAVLLLTGAALGDRFGRRRVFAAGLALFVAASAACALAEGAGWLIAARAVQGAGAALVVCEQRTRDPMVPMRLFRSRAFSSGIASSFLFYASMYGVVFLLPQFLQVAQGNGPLGAGLRLLPWTATLFVFAPIAGALINRVGERSLIVGGLLLQAIWIAWIGLTVTPDLAYAKLVTPLLLAGAGVSMAMPAAQNAVLSAVAPAEIGKASGTFNMFRFLAGAFGIAVLVAVFAQAGGVDSPQAFSAGFAPALGVSAALSLLAAIAGLWQPARGEGMLAPVAAQP